MEHPSLKRLSKRTISRRIDKTRKEIGTYHSRRTAGAYYASQLGIDVYKLLQDKPDEISELQKIGTSSTPINPVLTKTKTRKRKSEKVYPKGHVYDFYRDIQSIIKKARKEVFLIDSYADEEILDLYLAKMPKSVEIRILTKEPKGNFVKVATKFRMKPNIKFEVRKSNDCHDRLFS